MSNVEKDLKVKILVLGNSGVGKSSFTHLLCHNQANKNPGYTIGCTINIKLHEYKPGTSEEKTFCIEIWDIGASNSHASSRFMFYNNINGIILVHDLTNFKSLQNIPIWLTDVLKHDATGGLTSVKVTSQTTNPTEDVTQCSIPLLVVGTKLDMIGDSRRPEISNRSKLTAVDLACSEIQLDTLEPRYIAAGSGNAVKLSRFFDKAIAHALQRRTTTIGQSPLIDRRSSIGGERRRPNVGNPFSRRLAMKTGHQD
uniref:Rab-like protein 3 n=1 Tax=Ciona savignyi TaxID=51511 RepID=H2YKK2_CIOSA